ncbi:MAG: rRNA pseudouridine synthase [Spirochaetales bacterium]|nr:rRNA pseudouridine synthase [Spirochaetales bacterium]
MRLNAFLAKAGLASRRGAEKLIAAGKVKVNGATVTSLGTKVAEGDVVTCGGERVAPLSRRVYLAVNKPVGYLCTQRDERGRPKVIDLVPQELRPGLFHAGRLDYMSAGLIFYTNDGEFANAVTHPSAGVEKEYLLEANHAIPERMLADYVRGIALEGDDYRLLRYVRETDDTVRLVLGQGKNREIRRVCAAYGVKVRRLTRIRIGSVLLGGLSPGHYRMLGKDEIRGLLKRKTKFSSDVEGFKKGTRKRAWHEK